MEFLQRHNEICKDISGDKRTTETKRKIKGGKYRLIDLNNPTTKIKGGKSFEEVIKEIKKSNKWKMNFLGLKFN